MVRWSVQIFEQASGRSEPLEKCRLPVLPPNPMPIYKSYYIPHSIQDALKVLDNQTPEKVRLIAGGTDLLLDLQQERHPPLEALVDVTQIPELQKLEPIENKLFIGAAVPLKVIANSPLVQQGAKALSEATGLIGGPQVRNSATLGGNVAHALPAGDGTIALAALGATAQIAAKAGIREVPMLDLYAGPGKTRLKLCEEILVGFFVPITQNLQASSFKRVMRPQGVALPIVNMAIWVQRNDARIADIRISVGPAGPTPQRGFAAESVLIGRRFETETVDRALDALLNSVHFRTSPQRGTAKYRRHLCGVLLRDTLQTAWERTF